MELKGVTGNGTKLVYELHLNIADLNSHGSLSIEIFTTTARYRQSSGFCSTTRSGKHSSVGGIEVL